jgi:hypothetical protein
VDEADAELNGWTTSKHGKVEWNRLIGMPLREKANGPMRARANFYIKGWWLVSRNDYSMK